MTSEQPKNSNQTDAVQHDSETPFAKKPSVLFILSTSIGVITILTVVISVYRGVAGL